MSHSPLPTSTKPNSGTTSTSFLTGKPTISPASTTTASGTMTTTSSTHISLGSMRKLSKASTSDKSSATNTYKTSKLASNTPASIRNSHNSSKTTVSATSQILFTYTQHSEGPVSTMPTAERLLTSSDRYSPSYLDPQYS